MVYVELTISVEGHVKGFWNITAWKEKFFKAHFNVFIKHQL